MQLKVSIILLLLQGSLRTHEKCNFCYKVLTEMHIAINITYFTSHDKGNTLKNIWSGYNDPFANRELPQCKCQQNHKGYITKTIHWLPSQNKTRPKTWKTKKLSCQKITSGNFDGELGRKSKLTITKTLGIPNQKTEGLPLRED